MYVVFSDAAEKQILEVKRHLVLVAVPVCESWENQFN